MDHHANLLKQPIYRSDIIVLAWSLKSHPDTLCMVRPQAEPYKVFNELHCGELHINIRLLEEVMYDTHFLKTESDNKGVEVRVKLLGYIQAQV